MVVENVCPVVVFTFMDCASKECNVNSRLYENQIMNMIKLAFRFDIFHQQVNLIMFYFTFYKRYESRRPVQKEMANY